MKVPYATTWQNEIDDLRKIVLSCGLVEALKWGKPAAKCVPMILSGRGFNELAD